MFKDNPFMRPQSDDIFGQLSQPSIRARRVKWDYRFLDMVKLVGSWSKDPSTKVGAVIVRPDNTVASIGYNGFPRGMSDKDELYADREVKYSRVVHGEMNAILNAHGPVSGCTLYVPMLCCDRCAVHVIQAGITRVVCEEPSEDMKSRWQKAFDTTRAMFKEAGVEVVEYSVVAEKFENLLKVRVTIPTVAGDKQIVRDAAVDPILMTKLSGVDLSTDEARLDYISAVALKASDNALRNDVEQITTFGVNLTAKDA